MPCPPATGGIPAGSVADQSRARPAVPPALTRDPDGSVAEWNAGCEQLFGIPAAVARGRDAHALLGTIFPAPRAEMEAALRRDGSWSGELRLRLPDGRNLAVAAHWRLEPPEQAGGPERVVETMIDLTAVRAVAADLHALAEGLPGLLSVSDAAGRTIYVNQGFRDFTGLPEAALLGDGWLAALHPEDRDRVAAAWAGALRDASPYEAECRFLRHDGAWRRFLCRGLPVRDTHGRIVRWCGLCTEVEALRGAEAELARERARLALAQEAAGLGLWDLDLGTGRAWVSPGYRALLGLPPDGEMGLAEWLALLHPEDRPAAEAAVQAAIDAGAPFLSRFRIHRADTGALRWVESRGRRLDGPGEPGRFLGVSLDITAQKAEEERTALRMREVDHRAKNALTTVQALLRLTRADSPQDYARALEGRIATLGRAHALLAGEGRTGAGLRALLEAEFAPYLGGGRARLVLEGPALVLAADAVQPLSMMVHELVTNAAKYGALSRPGGRVSVAWAVMPEGWLHLDWREAGGPPLAGPPARLGFGSSLLRSLATGQLGGSVEKRWEADGLQCRITLPPRVLAPPG